MKAPHLNYLHTFELFYNLFKKSHMKKVLLLGAVILSTALFTTKLNAQAKQQISFGLVGVSYEIPVSNVITIAPTAYTNFNLSHLTLGVKANYYFDDLIGLPSEWDVYGGVNGGFGVVVNNDNSLENGINFGLQIGGRWFWNETWGIYIEGGAGAVGGAAGGLGLTMVL